jgi:cytochrome c biogenesis protein
VPEGSNFCPVCGRALGSLERPRPAAAAGGGWIDFIDRSWDFFSSTKVAVVLIVVIAIASATGTLVEQDSLYQDWRPPAMYYPDRYGPFWGNLFMKLGLTHTYSSVWYVTLILLLFINLVIGSLHRLVPLQRMLTHPQIWKLPHFIQRQEVLGESDLSLDEMEAKLTERGFKMHRDRECLYGDKGRLSRYGPYIIHIGLLIVCTAAFLKAVPGWDQSKDVWIPDGQTVKVPETNFALTNHKFTMELYPNGAPARFATDASVMQDGKEMVRKTIEVNHPLAYGDWEIYQASWREEPGTAHVQVIGDVAAKPVLATIAIDLRQPEQEYPINERLKMVVTAYYHDMVVDPQSQQPTNASFEVKNPVFMVEFVDTQTGAGVGRAALPVLAKGQPVYDGPIFLQTEKVDTRWYTAMKLHRDRTTPFMFIGLSIVMLGMAITFFLFHWQVWVRAEDGKLMLGARAYKNKFGLKQEFKRLLGAPNGEGTIS